MINNFKALDPIKKGMRKHVSMINNFKALDPIKKGMRKHVKDRFYF